MTHFLKRGENLFITQPGAYDIRDGLPVGTYMVNVSLEGFFLTETKDFDITGKIYGNSPRQADRILDTFLSRPASTGVLLNGEKGSGKTLLAKLVTRKAAERGIPTIIVNNSFNGDAFNKFIQDITEPKVVVFDEFEKVYSEKDQEALLTLLDGVYPSKTLFVLTSNDRGRINSNMTNRPGRIFYALEYKGLEADFIRSYCEDNLLNKEYLESVVRLTMVFDSINFDMLKALVEEMNRYNESPQQALEMLNVKPFVQGSYTTYDVKVMAKGKEFGPEHVNPDSFRGNPMMHNTINLWIDTDPNGNGEDTEEETSFTLDVDQRYLKAIDVEKGTFTYVLNEGTPDVAVVVFSKEKAEKKNWQDYVY